MLDQASCGPAPMILQNSILRGSRFIGRAATMRVAFPHVPAAAASQVGAEKGYYLVLVQLIGRPASARPALPLRPCIGDADDYFSRILLVGILTGVPTLGSSLSRFVCSLAFACTVLGKLFPFQRIVVYWPLWTLKWVLSTPSEIYKFCTYFFPFRNQNGMSSCSF